MNEPKKLTDHLSVREQVMPKEIDGLKAAGFRSLILNRPDGEGGDQPTFAEIEAAAKSAGMEARYIPVETGKVSDEDAATFGAAMDELPKPVLAFCRSGMRSTTLWALSQAGQRPLPDILARAKSAGYDMAGVTRRIANNGRVPTDTADNIHILE